MIWGSSMVAIDRLSPEPQTISTATISLYVDGSSTGKSERPCGWGWVVVRNDKPLIAGYGGQPKGTNNIAELMAAIDGLKALRKSQLLAVNDLLEMVSDSQYMLGLASGKFFPSKNVKLVEELKSLCRGTVRKFRWVRGHRGDTWNERADSLAKLGKSEASKNTT